MRFSLVSAHNRQSSGSVIVVVPRAGCEAVVVVVGARVIVVRRCRRRAWTHRVHPLRPRASRAHHRIAPHACGTTLIRVAADMLGPRDQEAATAGTLATRGGRDLLLRHTNRSYGDYLLLVLPGATNESPRVSCTS